MNNTTLNDFLKKKEVIDFIMNDKLMLPFVYDNCPMYIVKEDSGVNFYLQFDDNRDYSRIKKFVLEAKSILSKKLEAKREKDLSVKT